LENEAGNKGNPLVLTSEAEEGECETTDPSTWFKISPRQNPRHFVSVTSAVSEEDGPENTKQVNKSPPTTSPSDSKSKFNAEAFTAEKSRQHQLTSSARFELIRKQRQQVREKIHAACGKARKVKERARRDSAIAQACLVDDDDNNDNALLEHREPYVLVNKSESPSEYVDFTVSLKVVVKESAQEKVHAASGKAHLVDVVPLVAREPYVLVDASEAPSEYVDFTTSLQVAAKESSGFRIRTSARLGKKVLSPMKNWKGEEMDLARGAAYVRIVVDE
jgi:hypothetical protein